MNKILKLLKGKSLKGLGRLTALAWLFTADTPDRDALSVTGVPEPYLLLSGESAPETETEKEIVRQVKVEILRGKIDIE